MLDHALEDNTRYVPLHRTFTCFWMVPTQSHNIAKIIAQTKLVYFHLRSASYTLQVSILNIC